MPDTERNQDLIHLRPSSDDEIDLGELIRKLINEWQSILLITLLGAVAGVSIALSLPKQYRIEAVFSRPSMTQIAPFLSQSLIPLDRQQIMGELLKNLQSRSLLEQALQQTDNFVDHQGAPLSDPQRVSKITTLATALQIAPAAYDFLPDSGNNNAEFDQISISTLSADPASTKVWLAALLDLAEQQTMDDLVADIEGQQTIELQKLSQQMLAVTNTASANQQRAIEQLTNALAIAKSLDITKPRASSTSDTIVDYNKGSVILMAELAALKNQQPTLQDVIVGYQQDSRGNLFPTVLSPQMLQGQLAALQQLNLDLTAASLLDHRVQIQVPAQAEKPNRTLIAVAATVLAGVLGLFVTLIRIAIREAD
jgi:LPS O-antigen subunit length determinant protein (WzzB/FepE family)